MVYGTRKDVLSSSESDEHSEEENMNEEEAVVWFRSWTNTPHTLRQQCRILIRYHIGARMVSNPEFPIPECMQHYLTLREVDEIKITGYHPLF